MTSKSYKKNINKNHLNQNHCHAGKKPVEIYTFVEPLCPECWALEPILKKLHLEYGKYFTMKYVISGRLQTLNFQKKNQDHLAMHWEKTASRTGLSCDGDLWLNNPISSPYLASIAIKAAELQGRRAGIRYLRKLQQLVFFEKQNIAQWNILVNCAEYTGLDVDEFVHDVHSPGASKAFQCDLKITTEMDVTEVPTLVYFNILSEEEGIKISGYHTYDIYVQVLEETLKEKLEPSPLPSLESFLEFYKLAASKELAIIYDKEISEIDKEMKRLLLKQQVEQIPAKYGTFWRYIDTI